MKINYRQRLFLWFLLIFALFTGGVLLFEHQREKREKTEALRGRLDVYAGVAWEAIRQSDDPVAALDSLKVLFPENLRLTLIDKGGNVLYDNEVLSSENHFQRPEIASAREAGSGAFIRTSATNRQQYLYYAKYFGEYYLRVALPYDLVLRDLLRPDALFFSFIIVLFALALLSVNFVSGRFGKSIRRLRDFALAAREEGPGLPGYYFPNDELGEIGAKIAENYRQMRENKRTIALEREKLLQHVHSSEEGICFYGADRSVEFYNGLFIQYINTIADGSDATPTAIFTEKAFEPVRALLEEKIRDKEFQETRLSKQGKHFAVRINRFEDGSFEITLNDITSQEKTRLLKQEMTGNIAHELRTPVTTVRGYLETLLEQSPDPARQRLFLEKAYSQTLVLSELIRDISLITKIEEAPQLFSLETVGIRSLLEELRSDLETDLQEKNIRMEWTVGAGVEVSGNRHLLYSIFRNLTDNAIRYAGDGVTIFVSKYNEDAQFYYFSFADNGVGIADEQHLGRLFERFYRVGEGRTRDTGGSGLGLSIVRNAVAFHKGTIVAKNRPEGGLEFLFSLPKA